jgi:hypothetical protein
MEPRTITASSGLAPWSMAVDRTSNRSRRSSRLAPSCCLPLWGRGGVTLAISTPAQKNPEGISPYLFLRSGKSANKNGLTKDMRRCGSHQKNSIFLLRECNAAMHCNILNIFAFVREKYIINLLVAFRFCFKN